MAAGNASQSIPGRAGHASLLVRGRGQPRREGNTIILPKESAAEFHPLGGGRQFLFVRHLPRNSDPWFGGVDERAAFLVALAQDAWEAFRQGGERGFYQALKPQIIRDLERRFRVRARRQGDLWAVPMPYTKAEVAWYGRLFGTMWEAGWFGPTKRVDHPVFWTRHHITGFLTPEVSVATGDAQDVEDVVFAAGTITAPDHAPLVLKGMHVLAQSRGLKHPQWAD